MEIKSEINTKTNFIIFLPEVQVYKDIVKNIIRVFHLSKQSVCACLGRCRKKEGVTFKGVSIVWIHNIGNKTKFC